MARTQFEELEVYQLAEKLADAIWNCVTAWSYLAQRTIGAPVIRSTDAIGANIAEGTGRGSYKDNQRFIRIARGSLYETQHWLRRAYRRDLLKPEEIEKLKPIVDELGPRLNAYLSSIGKRNSPGQ